MQRKKGISENTRNRNIRFVSKKRKDDQIRKGII